VTKTSTPVEKGRGEGPASGSLLRELISRLTRPEIVIGAVIAIVLLVLVLIKPEILEAPFENAQTLLFTVGGTVLAAVALVAMLWLRVPPVVRVIVLVVPFAVVNWWLISPYFVDDVVDEGFSASITEQVAPGDQTPTDSTTPPVDEEPTTDASPPTEPVQGQGEEQPVAPTEEEPPAPTTPSGPALLGAGQFIGLAGHSGTGDAGIFQNPDGSLVLRFENFDIQNGPDLEVYLVPGSDQTSPQDGSIHLGPLKGNIGDQNYELPSGTELTPGGYTALVWCEAFSVEFVGATIVI
jgi:hypothetical protein